MQPDLIAVACAVLGVSVTVNGFFVKAAFVELRELRDRDREREVALARIGERVEVMAAGCPAVAAVELARGGRGAPAFARAR